MPASPFAHYAEFAGRLADAGREIIHAQTNTPAPAIVKPDDSSGTPLRRAWLTGRYIVVETSI